MSTQAILISVSKLDLTHTKKTQVLKAKAAVWCCHEANVFNQVLWGGC